MIRLSDFVDGGHLNSVWIEGTLTADPVEVPGDDGPSCRFAIMSPWASDPPSEFSIEASESAFDSNRTRIRGGKRVRIIGRLRQKRGADAKSDVVGELVELVGPEAV
jgi:hypothetical protein